MTPKPTILDLQRRIRYLEARIRELEAERRSSLHKGEDVFARLCPLARPMPAANPGYDFLANGQKIEVKFSRLRRNSGHSTEFFQWLLQWSRAKSRAERER